MELFALSVSAPTPTSGRLAFGLPGLPTPWAFVRPSAMLSSRIHMGIHLREALIALQRADFSECSAHDSGGRQSRMAAGA